MSRSLTFACFAFTLASAQSAAAGDSDLLDILASSSIVRADLELGAADGLHSDQRPGEDLKSRGGEMPDTLSPSAKRRWIRKLDLPNPDLGPPSLNEGVRAPVHIRQAVARATKRVTRCYRKARSHAPGLTGELISSFKINQRGRATDVRIVKTDLTDTMNRCVKRALKKTRFRKHAGEEPLEVMAPWTFARAV
jgi:hypothetical protein